MGVDELQCYYCKCVASEYSIVNCDTCDKNVCINDKYPCNNIKVPKMIFDDDNIEIVGNMCGYCQQKRKLPEEDREEYEQKEKKLVYEIRQLQKKLFSHYKQLEIK